MRTIVISAKIDEKIDIKHQATQLEIDQCFDNKCGINLIDTREDHKTDPPTLWFIAQTRTGRLLKIIYIYKNGNYYIKSAYEPDENEIAIYEKHGK